MQRATLALMAEVIPDPGKTKAFRSEAEFERWLAAHHDREQELWLKIFKKDSGVATVTYSQALDVALCNRRWMTRSRRHRRRAYVDQESECSYASRK